MPQSTYMIRVEKGPDAGFTAAVPPGGASLGRSSQNDLVFHDETLSRHHCRIWFDGGIPVVSDLATVNGTYVNGAAIAEDTRLSPGDTISIGATVIVLSGADGQFVARSPSALAPTLPAVKPVAAPAAPPAPAPAAVPATTPAAEPAAPAPAGPVDLGLGRDAQPPAGAPLSPERRSRLVADVILGVLVVALVAIAAKLFLGRPPAPPPVVSKPTAPEPALQFDYLKLAGGPKNVFRYEMTLEADGRLSVSIDDLAQGRRERKVSPAPIPPARREDLAAAFRRAGFASMEPMREDDPRAGAWNTARISALVDGRARTVEVRNAPEPEAFRALRETLETFGQNELGLWAFAFSREELLAHAEEALDQARRLHDEREVRRSNIAEAIGRYRAAKDYMESLNPKPEIYDEAARGLADAEAELTAVLERLNWDADHAVQTKEWARAAQSLREVLEYVPDRADPRHTDAERRLFDVEKRISK